MRYGPAYVTPGVLQWARESVALELDRAASKAQTTVERLQAAERGEHHLTLRQAELAAEAYGWPLATLFMEAPPEVPSIEQRFRRLRGIAVSSRSHELVKLERDIRRRQDAMVEVYESLGEEAPWHYVARSLDVGSHVPSPAEVGELLGLTWPALRSSKARDATFSRKAAIRAVEWAGVLVSRQRVPDRGVRGFLLPHEQVPAIYVNSEEHPRAQAYTIVHEFAHLLIAHLELSEQEEEERCDAFAAELLMPEDVFRRRAGRATGGAVRRAEWLSEEFGVTALAAAVRARHLGLMTPAQVTTVERRKTKEEPQTSGGDGNRNKVSKLSPTFTDTVLAAADSAAITLSAASRLLGTKIDDFDKLRYFVSEALGPEGNA